MKIVISFKELKELKNIMESIEEGSSDEFVELLKDNNIISIDTNIINRQVTVDIKEEYMTDYLNVYGRFVKILLAQAKSVMQTVKEFQEETDKILDKYTKEEVK